MAPGNLTASEPASRLHRGNRICSILADIPRVFTVANEQIKAVCTGKRRLSYLRDVRVLVTITWNPSGFSRKT